MGKPAVHVRRGDERAGGEGRRHRAISRAFHNNGAVTLTYDVLWSSGAKTLEIEVVPPAQARTVDTGFATPPSEPVVDDFEPA
jgi:hypothetical protein